MDKRYQVFVSSTFADLKDERARVIQTLMEMDCIPAGMELFPAADEEQLAFIKRVIDDCDYYLVIVGGRYGSFTSDGVSYTEKEYEYAVERGIKVIALIHESPGALPLSKSETEPAVQARLQSFRDRLSDGRLVKFWTDANALPGLVALSLAKAIKMSPAEGWVRAGSQPKAALLEEVAELRRENERLNAEMKGANGSKRSAFPDLAGLDEELLLSGSVRVGTGSQRRSETWKTSASWRELFSSIGPFLLESLNEASVQRRLAQDLSTKAGKRGDTPELAEQVFQTIKVQLLALDYIACRYSKTTTGGYANFWSLTPSGKTLMYELRAVRSAVGGSA